MSKMKAPVTGNITIRFPPPAPKDLGSSMRRELNRFLVGVGNCCAVNTGSLPQGPPGWCYSMQIKKPTQTEEWAEKIRQFLKGKDIDPAAVMEVRFLRGPVAFTLLPEEDDVPGWQEILFRNGSSASARLMLELGGKVETFEALCAHLRESIRSNGEVTHAYQLPQAATVAMSLTDARQLEVLLPEIVLILRSHVADDRVRLSLAVESLPYVKPL